MRYLLVLLLVLPAPVMAASKIAASGRYICDDGSMIRFTEAPYGTSMVRQGRAEVRLSPRATFAGFDYRGGGLALRGRGKEGAKTLVITGDGAPIRCNAVPAVPTPGVAVGTVQAQRSLVLPKGAQVTVQLRDTARADAAAPLLAQAVVVPHGPMVPIHWWLRYDAGRMAPPVRPALSARITDAAGKLIGISDTFTPLPAPGRPDAVIMVVPARSVPARSQGKAM